MSLLIKALNKAEAAQAEKTKEAQAEKTNVTQVESVIAKQVATAKHTQAELTIDAGNSDKSQTATKNFDVGLSLSPTESVFSEPATKPVASQKALQSAPPIVTNQQVTNQKLAAKSAANVFSAKAVEAKTDSTRLALIAGAGLIALLGMALYFYQFVDNTPPIVMPPYQAPPNQIPSQPLDQISAVAEISVETQTDQNFVPEPNEEEIALSTATTSEQKPAPASSEPRIAESFQRTENVKIVANKKSKKAAKVNVDTDFMQSEEDASVFSEEDRNTEAVAVEESSYETGADNSADKLKASFSANKANKTNKKMRKSKNNAVMASDSASIQVSKSIIETSVNPILMSAYAAYNAGNDAEAQKLYKQALKRDIHNVDALLGLGAIAARQGRSADANSWYGKVLEVDPRNNIARTSMLDSQSQGNEQANETSLKNMLAKQPNDANLHVALGNLYAEQNQWPDAQQAYFDAYSLNKTADNAYNLAVSLDQMGKPKLALPYYQRALEQTNASSNIDKAALEARIAAIQ